MSKMVAFNVIVFSLSFFIYIGHCYPQQHVFPVGFSYARFSGPVSGPEKKILIHNEHGGGHPHVDYVAKPDYQFSYGVDDPKSQVQQNRKEIRYGDAVRGEYSLIEPDGTLRIVKYTADDINGFQAEVVTNAGKTGTASTSQGRHIIPAVIPVHEPPVYDDVPITQPPSPVKYTQSPVRQQIQVQDKDNNSEYSAEHSTENEESDAYRELKDSEHSGSDESEDSVY